MRHLPAQRLARRPTASPPARPSQAACPSAARPASRPLPSCGYPTAFGNPIDYNDTMGFGDPRAAVCGGSLSGGAPMACSDVMGCGDPMDCDASLGFGGSMLCGDIMCCGEIMGSGEAMGCGLRRSYRAPWVAGRTHGLWRARACGE